VTIDESPVCVRHEGRIPMSLRSIHSDAARPDTAVGLFECPECGFERRVPLAVRSDAE
jgi:hypothetical protein